MASLKSFVRQFENDANRVSEWASADENTSVDMGGGPVRSPAKLIKDNDIRINETGLLDQVNDAADRAEQSAIDAADLGGLTTGDALEAWEEYSEVPSVVNMVSGATDPINDQALSLANQILWTRSKVAPSIQSVSDLRSYSGFDKRLTLTGVLGQSLPGIYGEFQYDSTDSSSADDGVMVIVDSLGRRWKRKLDGPLCASAAGVIPGMDCTAGLQKAFDLGATGISVSLPSGSLYFKNKLNIPYQTAAGTKGRVFGQGKRKTLLIYNGADTTTTLLSMVGVFGEGSGYMDFEGFGIDSDTKMTSGYALHIRLCGFNRAHDIAVGSQYRGIYNLWNGIFYDETDFQTLTEFEIIVQRSGLIAAGQGVGNLGRAQYDLYVNNGKISGCGEAGLHFAGGFDNAYVDNIALTSNHVNVLINNSAYAKPNQNISIGPGCMVEHAVTIGVYINDTQPALPSSNIVIWGHVQNNGGAGISVAAYQNGHLIINSPHVSSNGSHGIEIQEPGCKVSISQSTHIHSNSGFGIFSGPAARVNLPFIMYSNALGNYGGAVLPASAPIGKTIFTDFSNYAATGDSAETATNAESFVSVIAAGDSGMGVRLSGPVGTFINLSNLTATSKVIYPSDGSSIQGSSSVDIASGAVRRFYRTSDTTWITL